ncbi:MAG: hypothetical protein LBS74_01760 [Oscillospiraceae bacterium]|jgi:hypothetical protein|nr:hypothetical protein [Oscillospiraceae bacterium]
MKEKLLNLSKELKLTILGGIVAVIIVLIIVLIAVNASNNNAPGIKSKADNNYYSAISAMTPTDAATVIGSWQLDTVKTKAGKKVSIKEALGRDAVPTDTLIVMNDLSFSNLIGRTTETLNQVTGSVTITDTSKLSLYYADGTASSAVFDPAKQTVTLDSRDGKYTFVLIRVL